MNRIFVAVLIVTVITIEQIRWSNGAPHKSDEQQSGNGGCSVKEMVENLKKVLDSRPLTSNDLEPFRHIVFDNLNQFPNENYQEPKPEEVVNKPETRTLIRQDSVLKQLFSKVDETPKERQDLEAIYLYLTNQYSR